MSVTDGTPTGPGSHDHGNCEVCDLLEAEHVGLTDALAACQKERDEARRERYALDDTMGSIIAEFAPDAPAGPSVYEHIRSIILEWKAKAERAEAEVARLRAIWDNWTRENLAAAEVARRQALEATGTTKEAP